MKVAELIEKLGAIEDDADVVILVNDRPHIYVPYDPVDVSRDEDRHGNIGALIAIEERGPHV